MTTSKFTDREFADELRARSKVGILEEYLSDVIPCVIQGHAYLSDVHEHLKEFPPIPSWKPEPGECVRVEGWPNVRFYFVGVARSGEYMLEDSSNHWSHRYPPAAVSKWDDES